MPPLPAEVRYYDHGAMIATQRGLIDAAIARVLDRGVPDWGPEVPAFEDELTAFCGAGHAVTAISGTQAIVATLRALGIGQGDLVATVGNTDSSTPSAIRLVGASPLLVDIEPQTRCMDPVRLAEVIERVAAVLPVDMHGHPADYDAIMALAQRHGIPVIADACISLGATDRGRPVGQLADATCISFGAGKILGTVGTGGAVLTDDPDLARRMRMLIGYGDDRRTILANGYETPGMNVRLPELQAAVLRARLPLLPSWLATRRAQAAQYGSALADVPGIEPAGIRPDTDPAWRNYVIECDDPANFAAALARKGIETKRLYAPPIWHNPAFSDLSRAGDLPITVRAAERLLCLPIGPHLNAAAMERVSHAISVVAEVLPTGQYAASRPMQK